MSRPRQTSPEKLGWCGSLLTAPQQDQRPSALSTIVNDDDVHSMTNPFTPALRRDKRPANLALPAAASPSEKNSPPIHEVPVDARAIPLDDRGRLPRTQPEYLVPRAVAKRWSVCVDKVLRFIQTGELRAFNVASRESRRPRYRISVEEVRRFEEQTRAAAPPRAAKGESPRRRKSSAVGQSPRAYF